MSRLLAALLALACLLLAPAPAAAQGPPLDLPSYEALVREARAAAQRGDRLGLEDAAARLAPVTAVTTPDGATAPVNNRWLSEALAAPDPDLATVAGRLGAILDALAAPEARAPADAAERLSAILSRPPFTIPERGESLVDRFLGWLFRQLARLFDPLFTNVGGGPASVMAWVLAIGGLAIIGGVIFVWLRGLRRQMVGNAQADADDPEANLTAADALKQAGSLARGGDYRTAVRYLYLSSLLWLDEQGMLRYDRALTNREYLDRLAEQPALRAALVPIIETFDRVWYGYMPLDAESFSAYERQIEALRKIRAA